MIVYTSLMLLTELNRRVMGTRFLALIVVTCTLLANHRCSTAINKGGGGTLLSIKPIRCTKTENNITLAGQCMFVWDCMRRNGHHLSICKYNFLFGSCCSFSDSENDIPADDHKKQGFFSAKTTVTAPPRLTSNSLVFQTTPTTATSNILVFQTTPAPKTVTTSQPGNFPASEVTAQLYVSSNDKGSISVFKPPEVGDAMSVTGSYGVMTQAPVAPPSVHVTTTKVPSTTAKYQYTFKTYEKNRTSPPTFRPVVTYTKAIINAKTSAKTATIVKTKVPTTIATTSTTTTKKPEDDIKWDYYKGCGIPPLFQNGRPGHTRIVGGRNTAFGQYPWQVSVRRTSFFGFSSTHRCGGALIDAQWVATAGHCVDDLMKSQIRIRIGEYDFARNTEAFHHDEVGIIKKIVHPNYNFFTYEYDLALIKLEKKLDLRPNVWPICLPPDQHDHIGLEATVTGWGRLNDGGILPSILQEVQVPILSNEKCKNMFLKRNKHEFIPDIFMCAGYENGGMDSCQGDSGGPLQIKRDGRWFLAGIISWGIGCAEPNLPGVSTRISKFKNWILTQLQNNQ